MAACKNYLGMLQMFENLTENWWNSPISSWHVKVSPVTVNGDSSQKSRECRPEGPILVLVDSDKKTGFLLHLLKNF